MDKFQDDYRGYTVYVNARLTTAEQWVGLYSAFEIGPNDTYRGVIQGTVPGPFMTEVDAKSASVVECKKSIDRMLRS